MSIATEQVTDLSATLRFTIVDSGIGIADNKRDQLFTAFTQVDKSTTRTYGGTGLGLSISQKLVHLMGGDIDVQSIEGHGAEFWFTVELGLSGAADASVEIDNLVPLSLDSDRAIRVLVAEDNIVNQKVVTAMLKRCGIEATIAGNGTEAIEYYRSSKGCFSAILMDLEMPKIDGYSATESIRRIEHELSIAATPIIALTAHALEDNINRCYSAGMDAVLTKPLHIDALIQMLKNHQIIPQTQ
jgi:CheY-like chemotaxis protein